jgi:hypothetical protein
LKLLILATIGALVVILAVKLRATRESHAGLDAKGKLPGSFDTWPEVPRKQSA